MLKFKNRIKFIFLALLVAVFVLNFTSLYSLISYAETDNTGLSQDDKDLLKYYHESTIDENFEDDEKYLYN